MLSLHRDTPLDLQAAAPAASAHEAPAPPATAPGRDDGFAGFTLKGGKGGGAKKEPVVPQRGNIAGAAYLLHKVHSLTQPSLNCSLTRTQTLLPHSCTQHLLTYPHPHPQPHPPPTNCSLVHPKNLILKVPSVSVRSRQPAIVLCL